LTSVARELRRSRLLAAELQGSMLFVLERSLLTGCGHTDHSGGLTAHRKAKHARGVVLTELITKQQFCNKFRFLSSLNHPVRCEWERKT
jgi:hypothetical protein